MYSPTIFSMYDPCSGHVTYVCFRQKHSAHFRFSVECTSVSGWEVWNKAVHWILTLSDHRVGYVPEAPRQAVTAVAPVNTALYK